MVRPSVKEEHSSCSCSYPSTAAALQLQLVMAHPLGGLPLPQPSRKLLHVRSRV